MTEELSKEIIEVPSNSLYNSPVISVDQAIKNFTNIREFTSKCLTEGIDYGKFVGINKPSLLKPGAEKLGNLFGFSPKFDCVDKVMNWTGAGNPDNEPFFYFEYRCNLYKNGEFIASCDGSCNSWEKKYRYRRGELLCPECGKPTIKRSKYDNGGFYCFAKIGGCGAKFQANDKRITEQRIGDVKNFDTAEQVNTFQKMAQKRAFIGAIVIACNLSEYFTQDIEDMSDIKNEPAANVPDENIPMPPESEIINADYNEIPPEPEQFNEAEFLKNFNAPENVPYITPAKANAEVDSKGNVYKDIPTEELRYRFNTLMKFINGNKPEDKKKEALNKLGVISAVISDRKAKLNIKPAN